MRKKMNKQWKKIQETHELSYKLEGSCMTTGRYQKTDIKSRGGVVDKTFSGDSSGKEKGE